MTALAAAQHRLGLLLVSASALAWSLAGFFTRLIHLDTWTMIAWRGLFGGAGMIVFMLIRERGGIIRNFRRMGRPGLGFVGLSTLGMTVFLGSLQLTTVAHVAIIYATVPFLAAGLAWLVMRERPSLSAVIAGLGALAGVAVMVGLSAEGNLPGDLLALCMTFCMAGMMVISRHYQGIAVMPAACLASLLSGLIALPFTGDLWPERARPRLSRTVRPGELGHRHRTVRAWRAVAAGHRDRSYRRAGCAARPHMGVACFRRDALAGNCHRRFHRLCRRLRPYRRQCAGTARFKGPVRGSK